MEEPWRFASQRTQEFDAEAMAYDRYRPRYPSGLFDDLIELAGLAPGARVLEIGAGTGIATRPLADRGLEVIAVEPSTAMAAIGRSRSVSPTRWVVGTFEDLVPEEPVDLIVALNSWHWVEPSVGLANAASWLRPGGSLALVRTPVLQWGSDAFERALADAFGAPWPKTLDAVLETRRPVEGDRRFGPFVERRHRFERTLDAATFVAVTRTYGGPHSDERDAILGALVDDAGGAVTKVEEAVLYLAHRR